MEVGPSAAPMIPMEAASHADGREDTELGACAEKEHFRVGQQRTEVDHRADTDEEKYRHGLGSFDSGFEEPLDNTLCLTNPVQHLVQNAGCRKVYQNGAETHGKKQGGLIVFFDGEPDQQNTDCVHDQLFPCDGHKALN